MKNRTLTLCFLLMLPALGVHGHPIHSVDSLQIPEKLMGLPSVVEKGGDRAGTWGLPSLVALRYGLTVDETDDERFDEAACQQAALHYLTDLYAEFGDWELCYYAYLYSPAYVKNLQLRNLSIPQPKPEIRRPAKPKIVDKPSTTEKPKTTDKSKKTPSAKQSKCVTYTVKSGDTLSKIAKQHHVTVNDIKKWNNLKSDLIHINQKLKIYQ